MSLIGWENLACTSCKGTEWIPLINLIYRDGQGTTNKPQGYKCANCGTAADTGALVAVAKRKAAEQKIKDLESDIG